ncbi:hypothetical protein PC121_g3406 [Phytophthora cactorum]|nr:hypothetical protein PC121_g3406 [Phytophthora cactorum]
MTYVTTANGLQSTVILLESRYLLRTTAFVRSSPRSSAITARVNYRESTDFDYRSLGNNIDDGPDNFEWNCDQQPPPSAASSSNTATSSGEYDNSAPATTPSLRSESPTTSSSVGEEEDSLQTSLSSSASSSNTPTAVSSETGQQEELPTAQASNNTTSREHATIKSMPEGCVVGDPDTYISPKDLLWV